MKRILILFGGRSYEHDVSIKSAKNIYNFIDKDLFDISCIYISKDNIWYEFGEDFDDINVEELVKIENIIEYLRNFNLVFNIIHGNTGEDGRLQSLFELFNIKYIGSNSISSMLCMNKDLTKLILQENEIKQVNYIIYKNVKDVENILNYPIIIKPNNGGSSIGIAIANNKKELKDAIKVAKKYSDKIIVEQYIKNNIELECSVIERNNKIYVSSIGQVIPSSSFYDYEDKYIKNTANIIIPADLNNDTIKEIKLIAKKAFTILNCKDFARIDFLINKDDNSIYLNEINTLPGFTDISMFTKLLEYDKYNIKNLFTSIIKKSIN